MDVASGSGGGFECSFVGDVKDFECPLCLHVTRDPNLTSCCGQHFCQSCISRITADRKPCPFCKESGFTVFLDKKQKRRVLDLKVKCVECSRGCSWTGPLGDLDYHGSKDCGLTYISCSKGCGMEVQRRRLSKHLAKNCPKRNCRCKYCGHKDTYELLMEEHMSGCPKHPVSCPNNCTPGAIERASLKEHIEEVCPLQRVDCEHKSFGCTTFILRKDLAKHMEDNIQKHMLLMTKELKATKENLSDVKEELKATKEKLTCETMELNVTKEKLTFETKELNATKENFSNLEQKFAGIMSSLRGHTAVREGSTCTVPFTFYIYKFSELKNVRKPIGHYILLIHPSGHKLRLFCIANNNHVVFVIKKIDNNDLPWPLRCTVIIAILNQDNNNVHRTGRSDVCVENNDVTVPMGNMFDMSSEHLLSAVKNDMLLLTLDIHVNNHT